MVAAVLADLDGDGDQDLALESTRGSVIALFNDGTLSPFSAKRSRPVLEDVGENGDSSTAVPTLAAADLDGDRDVDLVTARAGRTEVVAVTNDGSARPFVEPPSLLHISSSPVRGLAIGDLNGDTRPDLALLNRDGSIEVQFADEQGRPGSVTLAHPARGPRNAASIALRDFDGDGDLDIALGVSERGAVLVNDGSARPFGPGVVLREVAADALGDALDFDGDGRSEALTLPAAKGISPLARVVATSNN